MINRSPGIRSSRCWLSVRGTSIRDLLFELSVSVRIVARKTTRMLQSNTYFCIVSIETEALKVSTTIDFYAFKNDTKRKFFVDKNEKNSECTAAPRPISNENSPIDIN